MTWDLVKQKNFTFFIPTSALFHSSIENVASTRYDYMHKSKRIRDRLLLSKR
jgi:hypothetical protein